jgi:hypothetical protein
MSSCLDRRGWSFGLLVILTRPKNQNFLYLYSSFAPHSFCYLMAKWLTHDRSNLFVRWVMFSYTLVKKCSHGNVMVQRWGKTWKSQDVWVDIRVRSHGFGTLLTESMALSGNCFEFCPAWWVVESWWPYVKTIEMWSHSNK